MKNEYVFYMVEEDWLVVSDNYSASYFILIKYPNLYINLGVL